MLLSTETKSLRQRVGNRKAIEIIGNAGFDAVDFTFDEMCDPENVLNTAKGSAAIAEYRALAADHGMIFNQAHAPFLFRWEEPAAFESQILPTVERSIRLAAQLGAPHIVVHPIHHLVYAKNVEYLQKINREYYKALLPLAHECGIRLALENMFQTDPNRQCPTQDVFSDPRELIALLEELSDDALTVCVDVGHIGLAGGDVCESLRLLGSRVSALHIHDNDYLADRHLPPYFGKLNWDAITAALRGIGYSGDFTFECSGYYQHFDKELLPAAAAFLAQIGRRLIQKIQD